MMTSERLEKKETIHDFEQRVTVLKKEVDEAVARFTTNYEEHERALKSNIHQINENLDEMRAADADHFQVWHPRIKSLVEETDQLIKETSEVIEARTPESVGWATGQAGEDPVTVESEGWVEGMGHEEEDSSGWSEGQGERSASSKGWSEGMTSDQ